MMPMPKLRLPHLETNMTSVCQNRCIGCNHFVPLDTPWYASPAQIEHDLAILTKIVHVQGYGMLGGEPTLHKELISILRIARQSGICDVLEVHTNGQDLKRLTPEFWKSFDKLVLTIYPGKHDTASLDWIAGQVRTYGLQLQVNDESHAPNFTALLTTDTSAASAQRRYQQCWFRTFSRVVDNGYFFRCCTSPYIPQMMLQLPYGHDRLKLTDQTTALDVANFLSQPQTPASCTVCAGRNTKEAHAIRWVEIKDKADWIRASGGTVPAHVQ